MNKKILRTLTALCAALVLMGGFSVTAFAQTPEGEDATNDSGVVYEEPQKEEPLSLIHICAARIQAELSKAQAATVNAEKFMNIVRKHMNFEELTHTLLREFVEKIVVHECSYDENGTRRQDIEIYYSFVGKVDLPE